ncbi:hypothetical protein GCM10027445_26780 [Amycolatopsis endophytica]|uniref:AcrR family transcriptional regulator n=1 Tax=Amycolatopsis endophytica TaxID=860233 RepID=A0A853BB35_9PSEU|nr:TetR/AcrR family transcriptional regulator [Amycolatopsis endophytica]NYI92230.1 AcrR family transcriptional regulator [Amycolatopsis endophytica]
MTEQAGSATRRRRRRTREETESDLLDAAMRILRRDGLLEGITLRDVAAEAGVNHGQIYQYFGSREALLRAAIARLLRQSMAERPAHWAQPFARRRIAMWKWALQHSDIPKLEALLALEGDEELTLFPELARTREALEKDQAAGTLPADADGEVVHAMTAVTYLGYSIFRETIARELGIDVNELDTRAGAIYEQMVQRLAGDSGQA